MSELSIETNTAATGTPLGAKDRIIFLDVLRGIAVLCILLMNITETSQSYMLYTVMDLKQPVTGANYYSWFIEMVFFEGTMWRIFAILFGAGTILLISRLEKSRGHIDAADIHFRRLSWLVVFGLLNAYIFLFPGDFLFKYAIYGLFLFPLRKLSAKKLLLGGLLLLALGTYIGNADLQHNKEVIAKGKAAESLLSQHKQLSKSQNKSLEKWHEFRDENTSKGIMDAAHQDTERIRKASFSEFVNIYWKFDKISVTIGLYEMWWELSAFMLIGMAMIKSGFLTGNLPKWVYIFGTVLGIGLGVTYNFIEMQKVYHEHFDQIAFIERTGFNVYQIQRLVQTVGYICLFILLYQINFFRKIMNIFKYAGQMAFTNYLFQSIFMLVIFRFMGWYGHLQRYELYYVVLGIWIFELIFSAMWLKYFKYGPFEWIWRCLSYVKWQPFRKDQA